MTNDKHPGAGKGKAPYNKPYFIKKFGISQTELQIALAEIHYGSPQELEDYLRLKYQR